MTHARKDGYRPVGLAPLRRFAAAAVLVASALPSSAMAQMLTRVDLDNDAFNFWQAPARRADREYSQGARVNLLWPTGGDLARRLLGGPHLCTEEAASRDCRMLSIAATQKIYTPDLVLRRRQPSERPFAGWLGAELGVQRDRATGLSAWSVTVGVTGEPSFGEAAQKSVHRIFGFREPDGWNAQLPTEVAFALRYNGARQLLRAEQLSTGLRLIVAPSWSARVGTLATDASAGISMTAGLRPPAPWATGASSRSDRWGIFARVGATQSVVARNLFLDGTAFTRSARVSRNLLIGEVDVGVGLRSPVGMVEWRMHRQGREYRLQPRSHAYSTFAFSLR